jgi:ribosomal protein S18 acetylase RimI-like enzyme
VSGWTLADAEASDVRVLARMIGDWVRETDWMPVLHSHDEDEGFVAGLLRTHEVRVARGGAACLGFLARRGGKVQTLHVAKAARGLGLGRALLEEVKAVEREVTLWTFQSNTRAIAFYRREGFSEAERTEGESNDERLPDIRLIWRRTP